MTRTWSKWPVGPEIRRTTAQYWWDRLKSENRAEVRADWLLDREDRRIGAAKFEASAREVRLLDMRLATGQSQLVKIGRPRAPAGTYKVYSEAETLAEMRRLLALGMKKPELQEKIQAWTNSEYGAKIKRTLFNEYWREVRPANYKKAKPPGKP